MVKSGFTQFAPDLIQNVQRTLRSGKNLNQSQREYLTECLDELLKTRNGKQAFLFKTGKKGAPKKAVGMRNLQAAILMDHPDFSHLSYEKKLAAVRNRINQSFEDNIDTATISAAYTQYNSDSIKFEEDY